VQSKRGGIMRKIFLVVFSGAIFVCLPAVFLASADENKVSGESVQDRRIVSEESKEYIVGVDDVIMISVLRPENISTIATVAPDGTISFPYIGQLQVKGLSLSEIQELIQKQLAEGYMKYPVVVVTLKESNSRKFFVYGEVAKPGGYLLDENTTVLKAISRAGGFTKYGSASNVKVLRERKEARGYDILRINIKSIMNGNSQDDILLQPGDIVVVSEGVF